MLFEYLHKIEFNRNILTDIKNKDKDKILVIKNKKDFVTFNKRYGKKLISKKYYKKYGLDPSLIWDIIDWKKVSKDYGGVEFCLYLKSINNYIWYLQWDVSSGVVWNTKSIIKGSKLIGKKNNNNKYVKIK